jgi:ribonucleoside-diphosphate reductase subunit M1
MQVLKRDNTLEDVSFDKITTRIQYLLSDIDNIDPVVIAQQICSRIYNKISTSEIDILAAETCITKSLEHPNYGVLASRIVIDNHQKQTLPNFLQTMNKLFKHGLVSEQVITIATQYNQQIELTIDYTKDHLIDFFGFRTLLHSYLKRVDNVVIERPQHMWMRVAIGIHGDNIQNVLKTYDLMSSKFFTHATPTLFHAGTKMPQMSSCFLLGTSDSVEGIYKTITDSAMISKWAGGIGIHLSNIRANGSEIASTGGKASGILPMLRVYNNTARYINQSGKRNGSFAMYLEPWHADIFQFILAKKNHGNEEERARDLFYALWIPDLFMERVKNDEIWSLMCPNVSIGLSEVYGETFNELYKSYEQQGMFIKQIKARELWQLIINSQIETGMPYMMYKDACNKKSNQKNIGTIKSSNLCAEIIQYSDDKEYGVCNLASVNLQNFLSENKQKISKKINIYTKNNCEYCTLAKSLLQNHSNVTIIELNDISERLELYEQLSTEENIVNTMPVILINDELIGGYTELWNKYFKPTFNFSFLHKVVVSIVENLNKIIDNNYYPLPETELSNKRHRPIGIGVQGLADVFIRMRLPFESVGAKTLNKLIFETIYHASLESSNILATNDSPYETFTNSPLFNGEFQFDLWDKFSKNNEKTKLSGMYNWDILRNKIKRFGVRNSLLVAPMPTASTSQILGNNECFEPYTSNIYTRRTLAGEFIVINKHLINDLIQLGIWSDDMKETIIINRGSVYNIEKIPKYLRNIYKTAWEIRQSCLIDLAADRGKFICQGQSLNIFCQKPTYNLLTNIHFYGWNKGLKSGSYYIRSKPAINSQQFTIDPRKSQENFNVCMECSG